MSTNLEQNPTVADAPKGNLIDRFAPIWLQPYLRLSRLDRPVGFWLLFWPCVWGLGSAAAETRNIAGLLPYCGLFLIGAIVMRGAGCTLNDILDQDLDAKVERTRSRPLPSGQLSTKQAWGWLIGQLMIGLLVWLCLPWSARAWALGALPLVAAYPFMKRITWWPQVWLGLTFSWGAIVGHVTMTEAVMPSASGWLIYAASVAWVIGYDTIYALQDREDDALVGIKSTALLFGARAQSGIAVFYALALSLLMAAVVAGAATDATHFRVVELLWVLPGLLLFGAGLAWQASHLGPDAPRALTPLVLFRSNAELGALLAFFFLLAAFFAHGAGGGACAI